MSPEEIKKKQADFLQELETKIRSVQKDWNRETSLFTNQGVQRFFLAALAACEHLLDTWIISHLFWTICSVSVLALLLFDLGMRPGQMREAHGKFLDEAENIARNVNLVDAKEMDALARLQTFTAQYGIAVEAHRRETKIG